MTGPGPDAAEYDYVPGMAPPVVPEKPNWVVDPDHEWWEAFHLRRAQEYKRRRARRRAILLTLLPVLLGVACYFVVPLAIERVNAVRAQKGKGPLTILGRKL